MKQTGGKANPALVGELLEARLAELPALSGKRDRIRIRSGIRFHPRSRS